MPLAGALDDVLLVDVDPETWAGGDGDKPSSYLNCRVGDVIEQVVGDVVVDVQALLLDEGVVGARVELQAGSQCEGTEGAVRATATS